MGKYSKWSLAALALSASVVALDTADASNTVLGSIWENYQVGASSASVANIPGTAPNITFTAPSPLDFASGNLYTIGEFLNHEAGVNVLTGAGDLGNTMLNTFFEFSGTVSVTDGQTFTVTHDDGLQLEIGGLFTVDQPHPTSPVTQTFTYHGPTGNEAFVLTYGECCGAPAVLNISLPLTSAVPESSTWAMMALGFAGLGYAGFRRGRKAAISIA